MNKRIAILGSGSWATALAKILHHKNVHFMWYFRKPNNIPKFLQRGHNPNYLTGTTFDTTKITFTSDLNKAITGADYIILAIPSIYLEKTLSASDAKLADKKIVSAIKGLIPSNNLLVSEFLNHSFQVPPENYCVLAGPSHSEEIAMERLSFLYIVGQNDDYTSKIAKLLSCDYIRTSTCRDVAGTEYASILKNIMAIAVGICHSLNFGDNFIAVLISNAIQEINRFLNIVALGKRDITNTSYLGDLLTTTYSQFSRNRTFGNMIGKGYSPNAAILEMNMIVEGYYALKYLKKSLEKTSIEMPILEAVYQIIYQQRNIDTTIKELIKKLL